MSRSSPVTAAAANTILAKVDVPGSWSAISAGARNNLAIRNDTKALYAWGDSTGTGQFSLTSWNDVQYGRSHALGLASNGALYAWGLNANGQLGDGTTINKSSPVKLGSDSWSVISAGWSTSGAIASNGALYMWGLGTEGRMGIDDLTVTPVSYSSPVKVGARSWSKLSVGNNHVAAITTNGELFLWGSNWSGQLGADRVLVPRNSTGYDSSEIGGNRTGIIIKRSDASGNLVGWGTSVIGDGTTVVRSFPTPLLSTISGWTKIGDGVSTGGSHYTAISSNGALYVWGLNTTGALGDGTTINKSSPTKLGAESWTTTAVGGSHTLAIHSNGALYAWGNNATGQLGNGFTINQSSPIKIGASSWLKVAAGLMHSHGITVDGALFSWGSNRNAVLGTDDVNLINQSSPVQVLGTWSDVTTSDSHTHAIDSSSNLYGWGRNDVGQIGRTGNLFDCKKQFSWTMVAIAKNIIGTGGHTLALNSSNILFTWGFGTSGQLGDGTTISKSSPTQIGTQAWSKVSGGANSSAAIHSNGSLFTWGIGTSGQLGDGTTISKSSPVKIGAQSWNSVFSSLSFVVAIHSNGALFTWGLNSSGQMGDGTTVSKSSPVIIGADSWTYISAGRSHTVGIVSNGALYAWGGNSTGQLGDGTTISKSSPVKIGAQSWSAVEAGENHTIALHSNGSIFVWGLNSTGQIGDGTTVNKSSPVKVGASSYTIVNAGGNTSFASNTTQGVLYAWGNGAQIGENSGFAAANFAINRSSPVGVSGFGRRVVDVFIAGDTTSNTAAGAYNGPTLAVQREDGTVYIFGTAADSGLYTDAGTKGIRSTVATGYLAGRWDKFWMGAVQRAYAVRQSDGAVFTWGSPSSAISAVGGPYSNSVEASTVSQIGNNVFLTKDGLLRSGTSLIGLDGAQSWTMFSKEYNHVAAIHSNGSLYTWGSNDGGQLGDGTTVTAADTAPIKIDGSWTFVSTDRRRTYAVKSDGTLWIWGSDSNAGTTPEQFGSDTDYAWAYGARVEPLTSGTGGASDGYRIWHAGKTDGTMVQYGYKSVPSSNGAGNSSLFSGMNKNANKFGTATGWEKAIRGPRTQTLQNSGMLMGLRNGEAYGWGMYNASYPWLKIGDGADVARSSPVMIAGGHTDKIASIGAGGSTTSVITANGLLFLWGVGTSGELGCEDAVTRSSPTQLGTVPYAISPVLVTNYQDANLWKTVKAGASHSAAINTDDDPYVWGLNTSGQLGLGHTLNCSVPISYRYDFSQYAAIAPTAVDSVKCTADGTLLLAANNLGSTANLVFGFGAATNIWDQGASVARSSPTLVGGANFACSPIKIGSSSWTQISLSNNFTMAITSNGEMFGWGFQQSGFPHYGTNSVANTSSPLQVGSGTSWSAVSAGDTHSLAITNLGGLYGWGNNQFGMIGLGTVIQGSTNWVFAPTAIGSSSWIAVGAGQSYSLAVDANGRLFSFGLNSSGQLGIGLTTNRSSPVLVATNVASNGFTTVAAGAATGSALRYGKELFVWGLNTVGSYGNQTVTISRSSPVFIGFENYSGSAFKVSPVILDSSQSWSKISAGNGVFTAINSNNALRVWGTNATLSINRLGLPSSYTSTPTAVGYNAVEISSGNLHSGFIEAVQA